MRGRQGRFSRYLGCERLEDYEIAASGLAIPQVPRCTFVAVIG